MQRYILHCDCNSFFASVELLDHPELKNVPVAVCGDPESRHGIILAKNDAAKKFKVQTAETIWLSKKKCPNLTLLPAHHEKYRHYSKIINEIYAQYSDRVEPFGIDESWIDVSGSYHLFAKSAEELANIIKEEVKTKTGLTISVGVSFNKVFAKLGSDYKKPDAVTVFSEENWRELVFPLPVDSLLYVGKHVKTTLNALGIFTIGQLANSDVEILSASLGKMGKQIYEYANGLDTAPVTRESERPPIKSIGNGITFKRNLSSYEDIKKGLGVLCDSVAYRLRKADFKCTSLSVTIKDTNLKSISRQKPMPYAADLSKDLFDVSYALVTENWDIKNPIRMLTVTAQNLTKEYMPTQINMFEKPKEPDKKRENLERTMDSIREKYGHLSIRNAGLMKNDLGLQEINNDE